MKRPVHHENEQSNVVSLSDARVERGRQFAAHATLNIGVRQQAILDATLRKFESRDLAPVAAAQVFVRSDGTIETAINNVEPEHIGPIVSALRRIQGILLGSSVQTARPAPRERGAIDMFLPICAIQIAAFAAAAYINTIPWLDVLLTTGGELLAMATCRYTASKP